MSETRLGILCTQAGYLFKGDIAGRAVTAFDLRKTAASQTSISIAMFARTSEVNPAFNLFACQV
jgi:hypothetical protein